MGHIRVHGLIHHRCRESGQPPRRTHQNPQSPRGEDSVPATPSRRVHRSSHEESPAPATPPRGSPRGTHQPPQPLQISLIPFVKVLKCIPKAARQQGCSKLCSILDEVVRSNSVVAWERLFLFTTRCLRVPVKSVPQQSLATAVKGQLRDERDPVQQQPLRKPTRRHTESKADAYQSLGRRVSSK